MYAGVRRITFLTSLYWIIWRYLVKNDNKKWQTAPAIYITTATGTPRIQRYALQLIFAPDVNNTGHVALFIKPKKGNSWSFGGPKIGQVEKWCSLSIKMEKFSFAMKSMDESSFGCSPQALYTCINSDHSNARTTKLTMRKQCDHVSSPFWIDKQSHIPESLPSAAKINCHATCHAYLWIRGLPVSIILSSYSLPVKVLFWFDFVMYHVFFSLGVK